MTDATLTPSSPDGPGAPPVPATPTGAPRSRLFDGWYGRLILPGVILQSVLIGGGYATGREIVEFGAKFGAHGWIAGVAIFVGFGLMAFLMLETARRFQAFDYRTLLKVLIGPLFWLFDIVYILLAVLIIAIMASATGDILSDTTGANYWVGVAGIIVLVGGLNFFGEGVIERFKTIGTVLLYVGYVVFASIVISEHWDHITATLTGTNDTIVTTSSVWFIIWTGILYVGYNLAIYPAGLFTARRQTRLRETAISGLVAGFLMTIPWFLTFFALMGFYTGDDADNDVFDANVPWLQMLDGQAAWLIVLFGVVVCWTLVETSTGMIYALIIRVDQNLVEARNRSMGKGTDALIAVVTLVAALGLARIGIIDLVAKGYTAMGYAMIIVFAVPLLLRGTYLMAKHRGHPFSPQHTETIDELINDRVHADTADTGDTADAAEPAAPR